MDLEQLKSVMHGLLAEAGMDAAQVSVVALPGGGNNRVFTVTCGSRKCLAKAYFSHPSDQRDRLGAEWGLLTCAWEAGLRCVPRPIARDERHRLGLYEFVEGRRLASAEVTEAATGQALAFFVRLNEPACRQRAAALRNASEACFTVEEHLALLDRRLARLEAAPIAAAIDREAAAFVRELRASWARVRAGIGKRSEASARGEALPGSDRCISPSDFGFHNALLRPTGELCFLDFEYGGWDDPAKAIGDFFCQPAVPVPLEHFDRFVTRAVAYSPNAGRLEARVRLLLPMFQIKWCCIMLNEFLPDAAQRRRFADPSIDPEQRKRGQLDKAQRYFQSTVGEPWPT
jgi:hypothetical protein